MYNLPPDEHLPATSSKSDHIGKHNSREVLETFEQSVFAALGTYSNVHRGTGHHSVVTTDLFEQARVSVLEYLGLNKSTYTVIFCTPRRAEVLINHIKPGSYKIISSQDTGIALGVRAIVVKTNALPKGIPFETGGGTTRLISRDWVIWAGGPDKFEAGTPAIINIIAFARALQLTGQYGKDAFRAINHEIHTAGDLLYKDDLDRFSGRELLEQLKQTLVGRGIMVPTSKGSRPYINFDNGASTPTFMAVWNTVRRCWNPSSSLKKEITDEVKSICAAMLGATESDYDILFTSNTTEAINLAAMSLSRESNKDLEPVVLNTLLEHTSNELPWRLSPGLSLIRLGIDEDGIINLNELEKFLRIYNREGQFGNKRIRLVAVSGASNVLGVYNDLDEIARITHLYGAHLLVDGAQLVAHRKVSMSSTGIDYLAFSAHKAYAPFGTGALVARKGLLHFSSEETTLIQSSGEENVVGIAALGKAMVLLQRIGMDVIQEEEQILTGLALTSLSQVPGLKIYGIKDPGSPVFARKGGVIVFSLGKIMGNVIAKKLSEQGGIGIRHGCHCAHPLVKHILKVSPGLERFQKVIVTVFKTKLPGVARVSFGIENTKEEVLYLVSVLEKIAR